LWYVLFRWLAEGLFEEFPHGVYIAVRVSKHLK
jgi:hypothetical protein